RRALAEAKVESQFARAVRYVEAVGARAVVPSAGPPCFLDPELAGLNVVIGDEISIFPDATAFLERLVKEDVETGLLAIPGTTLTLEGGTVSVEHPMPDQDVAAIFTDKAAYLRRYHDDWAGWLAAEREAWPPARPHLARRLAAWWEPLLAAAPALRAAVGA